MSGQRFTTGGMAEQLGRPFYRVAYVVRTRNIQPVETAGHVRLFDAAAVERVRRVFEEIENRRAALAPA